MSGERVKLYNAKMGEGGEETGRGGTRARLPSFFFVREFFSRVLLSERLEQAKNATKHKLV